MNRRFLIIPLALGVTLIAACGGGGEAGQGHSQLKPASPAATVVINSGWTQSNTSGGGATWERTVTVNDVPCVEFYTGAGGGGISCGFPTDSTTTTTEG